jgi:transposase InsO family protein
LVFSSFLDHAVLRAATSRHLDRLAMRALLRANELLGLAIGIRLAKLRDSDDPLAEAYAGAEVSAAQAQLFAEAADILRERWDSLPERRRPHYRPTQRYRILRIRHLLGLSAADTARWFRVSSDTILRWEPEVDVPGSDDGESQEAKLVRASPPVRRYADVRSMVQSMALVGFGGQGKIARVLARAGWRLSKRTVGRILDEKPLAPPPEASPAESRNLSRPIQAKRANDVILLDITTIQGLFGLFRFHMAVVFDVFARMPLVWKTFWIEPSSRMLARLLERASSSFGSASVLITDRGAQFTSETFRAAAVKLGIDHRFGAVGESSSIAILERFWKTLKTELRLISVPPLLKQELDERLALGLFHYAFLRPHQSLGGASPAEAFLAVRAPPGPRASSPAPRARPGEGPSQCPFAIRFLDKEQRLPFLVRTAA